MSYYVATKFALEGLTSSWSKELYEKNIRVHSISPGMINTKSFPKSDPTPKIGGVRDVSSIKDFILYILTGKHHKNNDESDIDNDNDNDNDSNINNNMMDYTGHYIHNDEYDQVINEKGTDNAYLAWKSIDEKKFQI
jgi:short-subunit dehydrogenase